jgi:hypothetical protein
LHPFRDLSVQCFLGVRTNIWKLVVPHILQKCIVSHAETLSQIVSCHVQHLIHCVEGLRLRIVWSINKFSVVSKFIREIQEWLICEEGPPLKANQRSRWVKSALQSSLY